MSAEPRKQPERTEGAFGGTAHGLADVGTAWARHGLAIGKAALETSAETLRATAEILGRVSERLVCPDKCCETTESTQPKTTTDSEPAQQA